ncbi:hypothetical protein [Aureimonas sp. Leaf324]|uniref:hypothetical protein n=1 Tax=Aureimonas sp. Leaf324 TaxID=1736336 RepID=UPI0006F2C453|nr:hypothetical protein [Aureimonas sp. Leaf324]KQQ90983.1 hypothetical protein ASF65_00115 [Aureimonas sp. Leaf324]
MDEELVTEEDFASLPHESGPRFLALESIARRRLNAIVSQSGSEYYDAMIRMQYMSTVASAAEALGIDGIEYPYNADNPDREIGNFFLAVNRVTTRMRLTSVSSQALSVRLSARTRHAIGLQIEQLRSAIESAKDLKPDRRDILLKKVDELVAEMNEQRVGFGKTMAVLAVLTFNLTASGTSTLADAPGAIQTITNITRLLGKDKQAEDDEIERLGPPPKPLAIEGPKKNAGSYGGGYGGRGSGAGSRPTADDMDDEIPF